MPFVDGFVAAVPTANKDKYTQFATAAAAIIKEAGALKIVENWGVDVPDGELTSMPMAVKCGKDETVVFSWVTWPSKEARDEGWKRVMEDPRMNQDDNPMPFDGKRMIYGGFETILDE